MNDVAAPRAAAGKTSTMPRSLYRYIWQVSGRDQIFLSLLAVAVFLLDLAPLELQRRIVNGALAKHELRDLIVLGLLYVAAVLVQGGLKYGLNVYRGAVSEAANRRLRLQLSPETTKKTEGEETARQEGVDISIIVSEVEAVGGFIGASISDAILNGGLLLAVFGYMLVLQPWMALVAVVLFFPQFLFIPFLQKAINRRTESRIKVLRALSVEIVDEAADRRGPRKAGTYRRRVGEIYKLNMQIFRRKFGMNFLMNLLHQLGVIGILFVGGWFVIQGRTEVGTVVAFISGLTRVNDPWGDLVNYFRDMTNARVKYRLIAKALGRHAPETRTS
ncbi:ABC-type bacteriocin/lantibiotic exporter with double-glycine peptidase domain [Inquilinus ginsengisoli]|uniref:ABC-type bacteriocin/lantibiotic exporter with double-glycine peptidase domain n=1 Tax=Inquilinus ginsengisoli TaxID=363840 RepID=A0ABU1JZH0_9PROT|nr:ABC transporter ATP-binding protein [Inquilinus ginsengisoli]MDR6292924.1 ABC-type bacteriocin/lantibiotic exporter with double-glycine peptidase domain [Inquilinus ginsengisoli]